MPDNEPNPDTSHKPAPAKTPPPDGTGRTEHSHHEAAPVTTPGTGNGFLSKPVVRDSIFALIAVVGISFIVILFMHLSKEDDLLGKLRDGAYARGVITFLIAIASIGLCYIMILHALFTPADRDGENFRRAREVLALLVGILGTIVGFYFGTSDKVTPDLLVADIHATVKAEGITNKWELASFTSGGTPGYRYSVVYEHLTDKTAALPANISNRWATSGWINVKLEATNDLVVNVEVQDKSDRRKTVRKELKAADYKEKK